MSQLDRLEALAQRLVEGTFNRFFKADAPASPAADAVARQIDTKEVLRLAADDQPAKHWRLHLPGRQLALGEPVINIGRALDNDIILSEPTVSRYHAQFRWRNGRYVLCPAPATPDQHAAQTRPIGMVPYTRVNGQPVTSDQHPLASGDFIEFGKTRITVEIQ